MLLDFKDESLVENLNNVISGLLPTNQDNIDNFGTLYYSLISILPIDKVRGVHYVLYNILEKYNSLAVTVGTNNFKVNLTKERFENYLVNNVADLILEPKVDIKSIMAEEGKSSDLNNPAVQQEMMEVLYEKSNNLYDICFELGRTHEDAMSSLIELQSAIQSNMIETSIINQRAIMSTGIIQDKRRYIGAKGWLAYNQMVTREVTELGQVGDNDLVCDNIEILSKVSEKLEKLKEPLANYDIPILDDFTPMLKHRLSVLVARENVGKTKVVISLIAKLIRKGVKVLFACGESVKASMFNNIVSSYIRQEYDLYFSPVLLNGAGYESLSEEDKQIVSVAKARIATSGLAITTDLEYNNVISMFTKYYNMGYEAFFIDHSQSLKGRKGRPINELVTNLALDCRDLKNDYPIYIMVTSHPASDLKTLFQKDQATDIQISPTAQSQTLSTEADELFILNSNAYLKRQGLLEWITNKRRDAEVPPPIYIKKEFNVSNFVYDAKYQGADEITANELQSISVNLDSVDGDIYDNPYDDDEFNVDL